MPEQVVAPEEARRFAMELQDLSQQLLPRGQAVDQLSLDLEHAWGLWQSEAVVNDIELLTELLPLVAFALAEQFIDFYDLNAGFAESDFTRVLTIDLADSQHSALLSFTNLTQYEPEYLPKAQVRLELSSPVALSFELGLPTLDQLADRPPRQDPNDPLSLRYGWNFAIQQLLITTDNLELSVQGYEFWLRNLFLDQLIAANGDFSQFSDWRRYYLALEPISELASLALKLTGAESSVQFVLQQFQMESVNELFMNDRRFTGDCATGYRLRCFEEAYALIPDGQGQNHLNVSASVNFAANQRAAHGFKIELGRLRLVSSPEVDTQLSLSAAEQSGLQLFWQQPGLNLSLADDWVSCLGCKTNFSLPSVRVELPGTPAKLLHQAILINPLLPIDVKDGQPLPRVPSQHWILAQADNPQLFLALDLQTLGLLENNPLSPLALLYLHSEPVGQLELSGNLVLGKSRDTKLRLVSIFDLDYYQSRFWPTKE